MEAKEKYYFGTSGVLHDTCTEKCMVKNNGVMIGSAKCQECEFMEKKGGGYIPGDIDWIICSKIEEATNSLPDTPH